MKRFIEGEERGQGTLLSEHLDDYVTEDNPARVVDVFVEELDLASLESLARYRQRQGGPVSLRPRLPSARCRRFAPASTVWVWASST